MWIARKYTKRIESAIKTRPVVLITGVRQTGKSSLLRKLLKNADYLTLDKVALAEEAETNPTKFLERFKKQVIIDEVQYAPSLFRELKVKVDENRGHKGKWILTGSQQFSLMKGIQESYQLFYDISVIIIIFRHVICIQDSNQRDHRRIGFTV